MATILVTGANGQLGQELSLLSKTYQNHQFFFTTRKNLDIAKEDSVHNFFAENQIDFCINAAAYTAVDKAEEDRQAAFEANALGAKYVADACKVHHTKLIHISTDYVFDGSSTLPYTETDATNPLNYYGTTKLFGEKYINDCLPTATIIRTSWVYSSFGHNFVKTMLRLMKERSELSVVNDQIGSPTYAASLANIIMQCITLSGAKDITGTYHYSSGASISWFQFAQAIKAIIRSDVVIHPIPTEQYPTPAMRSKYSVLDCAKLKNILPYQQVDWQTELAQCIQLIS